jgi:flagellar secretion chaperone FliS
MSYSRHNAAIAYREQEILSASPARLIVIIYDHMLANLRRAKVAIEVNNIEARAEAIGKARSAVTELLVSTDVERGGQIAQNLRSLYVFLFNELSALSRKPDPYRVERLIGIANELREGFAKLASDATLKAPAA